MSTRLSAALAILSLAPAATGTRAQDDLPRARLAGIARHADGSLWPGAVVHAREQGAHLLACSAVDAVEAITDERGRFALSILDGRPYAVWAIQELGEQTALCSALSLDVRAGDRCELTAGATPRTQRTLKLVGPGIDHAARLHLELREREISRIERLGTTTGEVTLPPGPAVPLLLLVTDPTGRLLLQVDLPDDGASHVVHASGPRCMRAAVAESDGQHPPIPGAVFGTVVDGSWFPIGTCGVDGTAIVDASFGFARLDDDDEPDDQSMSQLYAKAPGHHLGLLTAPPLPLRTASEVGEGIDVTCHPQKLEVRQCVASFTIGGRPLGGVCLSANATAWETQDDDVMFGTEVELELGAGADGRIDLTGLRDGHEPLEISITTPILAALPAAWRKGMVESIPLFLDPAQATQSFVIDLVADLRVVDLEFLAAGDGAPASGGKVVLSSADDHVGTLSRSDRTGRLRTLLPVKSNARIRVGMCDARGWCAVELDPSALGKDRDRPLRLPLPLQPTLRLKITTTTPDDLEPGSDMSISGYFSGGSEPATTAARTSASTGSALFQALDPAALQQFSQHFDLRAVAVGSDHKEWIMHIPSIDGVFDVSAAVLGHDALCSATATVPTSAGETEIKVELRLERQ